ncbi:MAG: hypothetical protein U1F68_13630 [Gammaproteobacteria bacterium]
MRTNIYYMSEGSSVPFDSELSPPSGANCPNWVLTILLRVHLIQINSNNTPPLAFSSQFNGRFPPASVYNQRLGQGFVTDVEQSPQRLFQVLDWTREQWANYKRRLEWQCNHYWNHRFWLRPPNSYSELDWPPGRFITRPNIWCALELRVVDDPTQASCAFEVVRLDSRFDNGLTYRSYFNRSNRTGRLSDRDILGNNDGQIVALHEIAHALGIDHIGIHNNSCRNNMNYPNGDDCYGIGAERQYINGVGLLLNRSHAEPWRRRITRHTNTNQSQWSAYLLQPGPAGSNGPDRPRPVSELPLSAYVDGVLDQVSR